MFGILSFYGESILSECSLGKDVGPYTTNIVNRFTMFGNHVLQWESRAPLLSLRNDIFKIGRLF